MPPDHVDEKLKILGIFAHPHDFIHCGGTCAHHIQDGDSVTIVSMSDGGNTHFEELFVELQKPPEHRNRAIMNRAREDYVAQKASELKKAAGCFGITDVRILPYEDRPLRRTDEMVEQVADLICEIRPDILITQCPASITIDRISTVPNDHFVVTEVLSEAITTASFGHPGKQRVPHRIPQTYYLGLSRSFDDVDFYVDVSDQFENRVQAEMCYVSQGHTPEYARKRVMKGIGHYGFYAGVAYAEPFVRGSLKICTRLPVTKHELRAARSGGIEEMKRQSEK